MILRVLLLVTGVWACSCSVVIIKDSQVPAPYLASYRLLLAAALLSPLFIRDFRRYRDQFSLKDTKRSILPGAMLGLHLITWIYGARMTLAANAALVVNLIPLAMPFLLFFMVKEKLTKGEGVGTAIAVSGVIFLAGHDFQVDRTYFKGDMICFVSMVLFATYLAMGRKNRNAVSIWLYMVPIYFFGGILCFLVALPTGSPLEGDYPRDLLMILGLAVLPTVIGHSTLNYSMKHMRGQFVSIATQGEFIFSGIMAFLHPRLREVPLWSFYVSAVLIVVGAVIALRSMPEEEPSAPAGSS